MHSEFYTSLDGEFFPANTAAIPVSDRLVRLGDGVFETIRVQSGVPYLWEHHRARLMEGLASLRIPTPDIDLAALLRASLQRNALREGFLRLSVARGGGSRGYLPLMDARPRIIIECLPPTPAPPAPLKLWHSSITRPALSALPVNAKLTHGIGSTLALMDAHDHGCDEAILCTGDGLLCEAASANLFWIASSALHTPPLATGCLAGTTRARVMALHSVHETLATPEALASAETIFLTNTRLGVWPAFLHGTPAPEAHPHIARLQQQLADDRAAYTLAHAAQWSTA